MEDIKDVRCESVECTIDKLFCNDCNRKYKIIRITHICDPLVPCERPKISYVERYYDYAHEPYRYVSCDECEQLKAKRKQPVEGDCPKCGFHGMYIKTDGDLCPSCLSTPAKTAKSVPKPTKVSRQKVPKEVLDLYFEWKGLDDFAGLDMMPTALIIVGKSRKDWIKWNFEAKFDKFKPADPQFAAAFSDLRHELKLLKVKYDYCWEYTPGILAWPRLRILYKKYTHQDLE
jgi:hypothetical protein